jgi:hypothetical protein
MEEESHETPQPERQDSETRNELGITLLDVWVLIIQVRLLVSCNRHGYINRNAGGGAVSPATCR